MGDEIDDGEDDADDEGYGQRDFTSHITRSPILDRKQPGYRNTEHFQNNPDDDGD